MQTDATKGCLQWSHGLIRFKNPDKRIKGAANKDNKGKSRGDKDLAKWLYLSLAALSGAAMALQGTFNAALGKVVGIWESTLIVHLVGTITVLLIMLSLSTGFSNLSKLNNVPWYAFLGGFLNVLIIYTLVRAIPQIGVGNATTAIIITQVLTAVCIDNLGAFGMKKYEFHYLDLLGVALLAAGARILLME